MLTVLAPAKLNLTLEVLAKLPDSFHEIRSIAQTIALCDGFRFSSSQDVEFRCNQHEWIAEESLVSRAVSLLKETTGYSRGAVIELSKRIPIISGLGGDSSDAVAVLRGLNKLWGLGLSTMELAGIASRLGSDVPFFLHGGTALLEGRGEIVAPLPSLPGIWVVLMVPPLPRTHGKTARLYASLKPNNYTAGQFTERLVALLTAGEGLLLPLYNVFEQVAFENFPGLKAHWQQFLQAGARQVHMAGSGPTLFTLLEDRSQAEQIHQYLQRKGLESHLTETLMAIDRLE